MLSSCYALGCRSPKRETIMRQYQMWGFTIYEQRDLYNKAMIDAAIEGDASFFEYLYDIVGLDADDFRFCKNAPIQLAGAYGCVKVLEFLFNVVGLTVADFRSQDNQALRVAAHYGHTDVLEFLYHVVKLDADDFQDIGKHKISNVFDRDHSISIDVLRFLFNVVGLSDEQFRGTSDYEFYRYVYKYF